MSQILKIDPNKGAVRDQLVATLRQAILGMKFRPGEKLIERRLCEMTGASRTALREALRQLEAEGLIEIIPNKGPMIPLLSAKEARQIYELRALLEAYLARLAAERANGRDLQQLREIFERIETAMTSADRMAIIGSKKDYYDWMLRLADNAELTAVLSRLLGRMSLLWSTLVTGGDVLSAEGSLSEISRIVQAVTAHDPEGAESAARDHILSTSSEVVGHLLGAPKTAS